MFVFVCFRSICILAISSFLVKCTALLLYCIIIIVDIVYFV